MRLWVCLAAVAALSLTGLAADTPAVAPSPVYALMRADADACEYALGGDKTAAFAKGQTVEVLQDYSAARYLVQAEDGQKGWVKSEALDIPPDAPTDTTAPSAELLEAFVGGQGYESATAYLLFTDIARQRLYVFLRREAGGWQLEKTFVCATGRNVSPTTRGTFAVSERGLWFYSDRLGSGARYWLRFNGAYLFHSVSMDKNRRVLDGTLGERRSSGCVRLSVSDAKWLYDYIPKGTAAVVY